MVHIFLKIISYRKRQENFQINTTKKAFSNEFNTSSDFHLKESSFEEITLKKVFHAVSFLKTNTVMFTVVNEGYVTLAKNWICNTKHMDIHNKVYKLRP